MWGFRIFLLKRKVKSKRGHEGRNYTKQVAPLSLEREHQITPLVPLQGFVRLSLRSSTTWTGLKVTLANFEETRRTDCIKKILWTSRRLPIPDVKHFGDMDGTNPPYYFRIQRHPGGFTIVGSRWCQRTNHSTSPSSAVAVPFGSSSASKTMLYYIM